jgi:non-ribosomal peptide synthase protein (TIGR01720 family)
MRAHLLEIDGEVESGQLKFRWEYSANLHEPRTIERLGQGFIAALQDLITHCRSPQAGSTLASDFPLAGLDQEQLSKVAKLLNSAAAN